ncbi:MAG: trigger factor [Acidobacteriota bacterium]|nr:trigger factor [Acidobacteriota bacterium]
MTVEITQVNSCRKNLTGEISVEDFEKELEKIAREYSRTAKVPGFRPGKVPNGIVRRRFEKEIQDEASQRIMDRVWNDAIDAHNLKPLDRPEIKEFENKPGSPFKFTFSFEELPPLEVKDYKGVEIKQDSAEVKDEDVTQAVEHVREQYAQFAPVEGEAKDGHYVLADVDGLTEGESVPIHDEDVTLIVGSSQTVAEFSDNLRGAKVNDTLNFEVSYPDDYQSKKIAGKKTAYTVLVKEIKERQLPELNDDFAKDIGVDNIEALREKIREDLATRTGESAEKKAREELLDAIIERQPIDVPECMVNDELNEYMRRLVNNLAYQGFDVKQTAGFDWKKIYGEQRPHAEQAVRRMIFLDAIARQENLEVSEEDISAELDKLAAQSRKSAEAWRADFEKANRMDELKQSVLQGKAFDFIYRNANIRVE